MSTDTTHTHNDNESSSYIYCLISNIPVHFHSKDLRCFFSEFVEQNAFVVFHFLHRKEKPQLKGGMKDFLWSCVECFHAVCCVGAVYVLCVRVVRILIVLQAIPQMQLPNKAFMRRRPQRYRKQTWYFVHPTQTNHHVNYITAKHNVQCYCISPHANVHSGELLLRCYSMGLFILPTIPQTLSHATMARCQGRALWSSLSHSKNKATTSNTTTATTANSRGRREKIFNKQRKAATSTHEEKGYVMAR